jgi:hypothetical protein
VAAWLAATLTIASALWSAINRQRVALVWLDGYVAHPEGPTARVELANAGRGTALAVRVTGRGCVAHFDRPTGNAFRQATLPDRQVLPSMASGDTATIVIYCAPQRWSSARLAVSWDPAPRLVPRRRIHERRLTDAVRAELPDDFVSDSAGSRHATADGTPVEDAPLPHQLDLRHRLKARRALRKRP